VGPFLLDFTVMPFDTATYATTDRETQSSNTDIDYAVLLGRPVVIEYIDTTG